MHSSWPPPDGDYPGHWPPQRGQETLHAIQPHSMVTQCCWFKQNWRESLHANQCHCMVHPLVRDQARGRENLHIGRHLQRAVHNKVAGSNSSRHQQLAASVGGTFAVQEQRVGKATPEGRGHLGNAGRGKRAWWGCL